MSRYNATWMNAYFVNLIVFLCCNFSLTLFVSMNMPKFTHSTQVAFLFRDNVAKVKSLRWAFGYGVFEGIILVGPGEQGMAGVSFLVLYVIERCRGDQMNSDEVEMEAKKKELKKM